MRGAAGAACGHRDLGRGAGTGAFPAKELQSEARCRESGWVGRREDLKVLPIIPGAKFIVIMLEGEEGGEGFSSTHIRGHTLRHYFTCL